MTTQQRISALSLLGESISALHLDLLKLNKNPWFTDNNIIFALHETERLLKKESLENWIEQYPNIDSYKNSKNIGVITAGNIPLVGFHDFLSVIITGHKFVGKLSSKDDALLPGIIKRLVEIEPRFAESIFLTESNFNRVDAVIATGSNNSGRYFDYYFGKYPHIIRKNRNSVAIITGNETDEQLSGLADDIFLYFGLGCRNVSKLFVPNNYNLDIIFNASLKYRDLIQHHKYANNYDYNRVIYLMNKINFLENGFLILKEDVAIASPISVVYYERWNDINQVAQKLEHEDENIQCIVSEYNLLKNTVSFGQSQKPELTDYPDNIDTIQFLINL